MPRKAVQKLGKKEAHEFLHIRATRTATAPVQAGCSDSQQRIAASEPTPCRSSALASGIWWCRECESSHPKGRRDNNHAATTMCGLHHAASFTQTCVFTLGEHRHGMKWITDTCTKADARDWGLLPVILHIVVKEPASLHRTHVTTLLARTALLPKHLPVLQRPTRFSLPKTLR